jgi:DNA-binding CsgD family transcriptional regulator/N-acetylneuraminic acid mutarotase
MLPQETETLSEREQEILILLATGASNKEIGQRLFISPNTVKVHLRNIFTKIGVSTRTEAALYAIRSGLVQAPGSVEALSAEAETEDEQAPGEPAEAAASPGAEKSRRRVAPGLAAAVVVVLLFLGLGAVEAVSRLVDTVMPASLTPSAPLAEASLDPTPWQAQAALPLPLSGAAACVKGSMIYLFSGEEPGGELSGAAWGFDPSANAWRALTGKPTPVRDAQAALLGGKCYLPGGLSADKKPSAVLEIFDPESNTWGTGPSLPEPRSAYALLAFEGRLYLFGGWDGQGVTDSVLIYDPDEARWVAGPPMPTGRAFLSAAIMAGNLVTIGGLDDAQNALDTVEIFEPAFPGGEWRAGPGLPFGRAAAAAVSLADNIYLVGGMPDSQNSSSGQPVMLLTSEMDWGLLEARYDQRRSHLAVVALGPALYALGGEQRNQPSDQVERLQVLYTTSVPFIIR